VFASCLLLVAVPRFFRQERIPMMFSSNRVNRRRVAAMTAAATLAFACLGTLLPTLAHADATTDALKATLQMKLSGQASVTDVRKSPINGLYEVTVGKQIFYSDPTGRYLLLGNIRDTNTGDDLTQARVDQLNKIDFASLPLKDAVKVVRGNGQRKIAVFSDPTCPYCHKLEETLQSVNNITVYTFLYPILSERSGVMAKQIWCSKDPGKTWENWMVRRQPLTGDGSCDVTALNDNLKRGQDMNVTGTPTVFLADGNRLPGAVSADDLEKALSSVR